jgi:LmbE family N-acetylglucosaminyl deacetylase
MPASKNARPTILVVAPHPDDETLGCGGTLLRHRAAGDRVHWLLMTAMKKESGYGASDIARRRKEIAAVAKRYGFSGTHELNFATSRLDELPMRELVDAVGAVVRKVAPACLYLPHPGDVHSDHRVAFEATAACAKWFRFPSVKAVLAYETLSETEFSIDPGAAPFRPQRYVDISAQLEKKLEIMALYASELRAFPFPRSEQAVRALAALRGSAAGVNAAEAFMVLKEIL